LPPRAGPLQNWKASREPIDYEDYWWMHAHGWGVDDYRRVEYARVTDILCRIRAAGGDS